MCGVCLRRGCVWGVCEEGNVLGELGLSSECLWV